MQQLNNIQEIRTAVNQYGEIVVCKSEDNVIIMSMEEYNKQKMIHQTVEKLQQSEEEIEKGEGIEADIAFEKLREEYDY